MVEAGLCLHYATCGNCLTPSSRPASGGRLETLRIGDTQKLLVHLITTNLASRTGKALRPLTRSSWHITVTELYAIFGAAIRSERLLRELYVLSLKCLSFIDALIRITRAQE